MGATNSTLHYNLSQFISTDKPAWLQDYNGDMQKIDTGINGALTAAESAQNSADSASSGVSTLSDSVSALSTTVAGHTSDITDLSGDVNTIESLIGNGAPTAGDHTLIGAINTNTADIAASPKMNVNYGTVVNSITRTTAGSSTLNITQNGVAVLALRSDSAHQTYVDLGDSNANEVRISNSTGGSTRFDMIPVMAGQYLKLTTEGTTTSEIKFYA